MRMRLLETALLFNYFLSSDGTVAGPSANRPRKRPFPLPNQLQGLRLPTLQFPFMQGVTESVRRVAQRAGAGISEVGGFAWHGRDGAEKDEAENEGPPPEWHQLLQLSRNASLTYYSADQVFQVYKSEILAPGTSLTYSSRKTFGVDGNPWMVRSSIRVCQWADGSVSVVDVPSVDSRMVVHRQDTVTTLEDGSQQRSVRLVVSFQGTANLKNARLDVDYKKVIDPLLGKPRRHPGTLMGKSEDRLTGVRVHAGFKMVADAFWRDLEHTLQATALGVTEDALDSGDAAMVPVRVECEFTGHSLGGAVAVLIAARTKRHFERLNARLSEEASMRQRLINQAATEAAAEAASELRRKQALRWRKPKPKKQAELDALVAAAAAEAAADLRAAAASEAQLPMLDVHVASVVTFGQPKVTNSAGTVCEAFQSLPLLRITHEDDMVPFIPTADPFSSVFGFYRHFGDHLVLQKDKLKDDDDNDNEQQSVGGSVLLAMARDKFRAWIDRNELYSPLSSGSSATLQQQESLASFPSVSDEGATEEDSFRVVKEVVSEDSRQIASGVDQGKHSAYDEEDGGNDDEDEGLNEANEPFGRPLGKREGVYEGIAVKVLLNETLRYKTPGEGRWVLEVQDVDHDSPAGIKVQLLGKHEAQSSAAAGASAAGGNTGRVRTPRGTAAGPAAAAAAPVNAGNTAIAAAATSTPSSGTSDGVLGVDAAMAPAVLLAPPWPWRWRAPGSRRHVGWLQYLLEAFLDRNSYWLHLLHSNPLAHSMANYESCLFLRAHYPTTRLPRHVTPLRAAAGLKARVGRLWMKGRRYLVRRKAHEIAIDGALLGVFTTLSGMALRTVTSVALEIVVSFIPSPIRTFTGGLVGWTLAVIRFLYRTTRMPPFHELVKMCVVAAFFVGFTGGLEGSGSTPQNHQRRSPSSSSLSPSSPDSPWDDDPASYEDDSAARERAFAALSEAGREGLSFLKSQSTRLVLEAKQKFTQQQQTEQKRRQSQRKESSIRADESSSIRKTRELPVEEGERPAESES